MQIIRIKEGQTLLDIAARFCGDASLAIDIAMINGIDVEDVVIGMGINVPDYIINKKSVIDYLAKRNDLPASGLTAAQAAMYEDEWTLFYTTGLPPTHG